MSIDSLIQAQAVAGLTPVQWIGIPLALCGAVLMSLGALYQHRGVTKVDAATAHDGATGLNLQHMLRLLRRPSWLIGTIMLALAIVFQLGSLAFAPLIVVQPLGVVSLLLTTFLTARATGLPLSRQKRIGLAMCVLGVGTFVTVAAVNAVQRAVTEEEILTVLVLLGIFVVVFGVLFLLLRRRFKGLFYILAAGLIYGFVATLAKITINRIQNDNFEWLTLLCLVALLTGTAVGAYFVQTAYASGPPDLVVAGLTVIDPIVAVTIGVVVLREADGAPWWAYLAFVLSGLVAVIGVFVLERGQTAAEIEASRRAVLERGSGDGGRPPRGTDDPSGRER